jgi:hypothetical protein
VEIKEIATHQVQDKRVQASAKAHGGENTKDNPKESLVALVDRSQHVLVNKMM